MPLPLAVPIAMGAASLVGSIFNTSAQAKANKQSERFAREMYQRQKDDNLAFWEKQNAYNDPSAQMNRLANAGLNPHLVYGNGADVKAGPIQTASAPSWTPKAPQSDAGRILGGTMADIYDIEQKKANIAQTNAQTQSILSNTANRDFLNQLNVPEYMEAMKADKINRPMLERTNLGLRNTQIGNQNANIEMDNQTKRLLTSDIKQENYFYNKYVTDLDNAKKMGDFRSYQNQMMSLEAELNKMGIQKNDQLWQRIIGRILNATIAQ